MRWGSLVGPDEPEDDLPEEWRATIQKIQLLVRSELRLLEKSGLVGDTSAFPPPWAAERTLINFRCRFMDDPPCFALSLNNCDVFPSSLETAVREVHALHEDVVLLLFKTENPVPPNPLPEVSFLHLHATLLTPEISDYYPSLQTLYISGFWVTGTRLSLRFKQLELLELLHPNSDDFGVNNQYREMKLRKYGETELKVVDISQCTSLQSVKIFAPGLTRLIVPPTLSYLEVRCVNPPEIICREPTLVKFLSLSVRSRGKYEMRNVVVSEKLSVGGHELAFPSLTSLSPSQLSTVGYFPSEEVLRRLPDLKELNLADVRSEEIRVSSQSLEKLNIDSPMGEHVVVYDCPNLEALSCRGADLTSVEVSGCGKLRNISLTFFRQPEIVINIQSASPECSLSVISSASGLVSVSLPRRMHRLLLVKNWMTATPRLQISGGEELKVLAISVTRLQELESEPLSRLESLTIMSEEELHVPEWLHSCTSLTKLHVSGDPVFLPPLSSLPALRDLRLTHPRLTECGPHPRGGTGDALHLSIVLHSALSIRWRLSVPDHMAPPEQWYISTPVDPDKIVWSRLEELLPAPWKLPPADVPAIVAPHLCPVSESGTWEMSLSSEGVLEFICQSGTTLDSAEIDWLVPNLFPRELLKTRIRKLEIALAHIEVLPPELLTELELEELSIILTGLTRLPRAIFQSPLLHTIVLNDNSIEELPEIPQNTVLRTLSLRSNNISELPPSIRNLRHLETLNLLDNPIDRLPDELLELSCLRTLVVDKDLKKDPVAKILVDRGVSVECPDRIVEDVD